MQFRSWGSGVASAITVALCLFTVGAVGCSHKAEPNTAVMIIESSPVNLDPRVGIDAQSERIGKLLYDALVVRDEHFNLQPWLAETWETPDPLTYVFHVRRGVRFHDGRPMTAADVKWTFDSILTRKLRTTKTDAFQAVESVEAKDEYTVVFHLRQPFAALLWNLSDGAIGIVPNGTLDEATRKPIGTGPFKFVSATPDRDVVVQRNDDYWGEKAKLPRVRFMVVPDATTRALELRKGSADAAINALSPDTVMTLRSDPNAVVQQAPGTIYSYIALNLRDPLLKDVRVRQAIAYAMDRGPLIHYLWRDLARPASSMLPPQSWAFTDDVRQYPHDPAKSRQILDQAGYKVGADGIRFHLTMKTSTEESTRLLAAVLQQQLREVGIALDIRSFEFATFFSDVTKGAFQLYSLRWIGGNEDPDIFEYVFESTATKRANRGFYSNPKVDALIAEGRTTGDQRRRRAAYVQIQKEVAEDLPYINLWYLDNVLVHSRRLKNVTLSGSGNYDFLKSAELQ